MRLGEREEAPGAVGGLIWIVEVVTYNGVARHNYVSSLAVPLFLLLLGEHGKSFPKHGFKGLTLRNRLG